MPENLDIIVKVTDQASASLRGIGKQANDLGGLLGGALKVGALGAAAGLAALSAVVVKGIGEASESQQAMAQLGAVLKATGGAAGISAEQAQEWATELQRVTRFSDEQVLSMEAMLLQFRSINASVFPQTIRLSADLATRLGIDTSSAARMLGKALETPGEGLLRLRQAGVAFSDAQEKMIAGMVKSGNIAGAQKLILDELEKSIGGAALAAGGTFAGQLAILGNQLSDVFETIGSMFLPVLQELVGWLNREVVPRIQQFVDLLKSGDWEGAINAIWEWVNLAIGKLAEILGQLVEKVSAWFTENWEPKIKPTLVEMAKKFLQWLVDTLVAGVAKFGELLTAIGKWLQLPETQDTLYQLGKDIGSAVITGVETGFKAQGAWDNARQALLSGLFEMVKGMAGAIFSLGKNIGIELRAGIDEALGMERLSAGEIFERENEFRRALGLQTVQKVGRAVPGFQFGGIVPGPMGVPQLAVVHGGEAIIPPGRGAGGDSFTFIYAPQVSLSTRQEAERVIAPYVLEVMRDAARRKAV